MTYVKIDYIKRIQSNLGRKVKVSRTEIKDYMEAMNMDSNQPTEEDMEVVKQHFLKGVESVITEVEKSPVLFQDDNETGITGDAENALAFAPEIKGMVGMKAESMGLQLAENQIEVIASGIDTSGQSFLQTIADIEAALISYIDYQQRSEANQVDLMLNRITNRVYAKNEAVNQQLNEGIHTFKDTLADLDAQQKKITDSILLRLKPAR